MGVLMMGNKTIQLKDNTLIISGGKLKPVKPITSGIEFKTKTDMLLLMQYLEKEIKRQ